MHVTALPPEADMTPPSPYHYFYCCHQAPDDCHQVQVSRQSPPSSKLLTDQTLVEPMVVDCHWAEANSGVEPSRIAA